MAKTSISQNEWAKAGFQDFISEDSVSAPNTQIQNRALISNSLKPVMGVERVMITGIDLVNKEFGPNGEQVYQINNQDPRFRFVGTEWKTSNPEYGLPWGTAVVASSFIEATFYGTGFNLVIHTNNAAYDFRSTVDGGVESGNLYSIGTSYSNVLGGRNYKANVSFPIVSGLVAGLHTVKIRFNATGMMLFGFEILNERSNILVNAGNAFDGLKKEALSTSTSSSYNAGVSGAKGARVVKYLLGGAISQAVTNVDASQGNLASATHANEEIVRKVNFREFGAQRADDLSTIAGSSANRVYTLDDGITTLFGFQCFQGYSGIREGLAYFNGSGDYITIVFVGTGLDWIEGRGLGIMANFSTTAANILVDGVSIGSGTLDSFGWKVGSTNKVVSGLPYGTHTVKFLCTAGGNLPNFSDFIIYQPKKPTLPAGAVEIADYNVMADYVASTTSDNLSVSSGVLRKASGREMTFSGATWNCSSANVNGASGFQLFTNSTSGGYFEYTFFGTGFEWRGYSTASSTANATVSLNGITATTTNFPTATFAVNGTGITFNSSTGQFGNNAAGPNYGGRLRVSGLPLALYKIKFLNNTATELELDCLEIITPIHINGPGLKVSNLSLKDTRNTVPVAVDPKNVDLSKAKAWILYDGANNKLLASNNISAVISVSTGNWIVYFSKPFKTRNWVAAATGNGAHMVGVIQMGSTFHTPSSAFVSGNNDSGASININWSVVFFGELEDEGI